MATWHPPIPASKLYSGPALELGPALAMLIWCYDGIQRDGTIEIRLESVQQELNVSYRTIKDWWKLLKSGPFFCELFDRGRRGWVVRMADDWVDWHVMSNNYPEGQKSALEERKDQSSRPVQGQEVAPETLQGPLKARSRPDEGQKSALEKSAYKVDQHDQESGGVGGNSKSAPAHFFQKLAEVCNINLAIASKGQKAELGEVASALSAASATEAQLDAFAVWWWSDNNWRTRKANQAKRKPEAPRPREVREEWGNAVLPAANGHKPSGRGPPVSAQPWKPPDDALSGAALQEAIAARMKKRE